MCGGQQAYPVYATVDEFSDIRDETTRIRLKGQLVHDAMAALLHPLRKASLEGVDMWCADGCLRRIYPIVAAYVADWPEQNLMACTLQSGCPVCTAKERGRGNFDQQAPERKRRSTLDSLRAYFEHDDPYVNISSAITPDLLHQIYQGVFKTHMMCWLKYLMGKTLDERFLSMPGAEGLRKFSVGWQGAVEGVVDDSFAG